MTTALRVVLRRFRLTRGFRGARLDVTERGVAVVGLFEGGELIGVGEAAPLPGYSSESLGESVAAIAAFDPVDLLHAVETRDLARASALTSALPPSARAAVEVSALDAVSTRASLPLASWLGATSLERRVPARLVDLSSSMTDRSESSDVLAFKVKVGPDRELALETLERLRRNHPTAELRADANRSLDPRVDADFVVALSRLGIGFLEEPFADLAETLALRDPPVALDESLRGLSVGDVREAISATPPAALVLKPTTLGFLHAFALLELARECGVRAIASHCFEGPIGYSAATVLALCSSELHPGLDAEYGPIDEGVGPCGEPSTLPGLGLREKVVRWF